MDLEHVEQNLSKLKRCNSLVALELLTELPELGMLRVRIPDIKPLWAHTVHLVAKMPPDDMVLRWAAMYHDIGKPAVFDNQYKSMFANHEEASCGIWMSRAATLGMEEEKARAIKTVISVHMRIEQYSSGWNNKALKRLIEGCGSQLENAITLALGDGANKANIRHLRERIAKWKTN